MASSDDEPETVLDHVTNYHFLNSHNAPVSFSTLPLHWSNSNHHDVFGNGDSSIALRGTTDGGLQSVYKEVIGWKLELSYAVPEVYTLCKGKTKTWIKLHKPRNSYGDVVKSVLIVIHCLHFAKRNVHATRDDIWSHLLKSFSSYDLVEPLENCLSAHLSMIRSAVAHDKDLAKSKYLEAFLMEIENPGTTEIIHEDNGTSSKPDFIACDDDDDFDDDFDDEPEELFDSVCAFCDNGGHVLLCEGQCIRSFHPTVAAGVDTCCESLGFKNAAEYDAIATFLCDNCKHQRHQCFVCGMLGSSDKSSDVEVFPCVSATCGHFYHPECVANLLYPSDETMAKQLKSQIAAGESFTCPIHKCRRCQQGENKDEHELQFAICRRCPKAYHRKCLPKKIAFNNSADGTIEQRAWDNLLPKRILMYCMKHKIIPNLETPKRDHLLFPSVERKNREGSRMDMMVERRSKAFGNFKEHDTEDVPKVIERRYNTVAYGDTALVKDKSPAISKEISSLHNNKSISGNLEQPSNMVRSKSPYKGIQSEQCYIFKPVKTVVSASPKSDTDMKTRVLKLMEDSTSSLDFEEFIKEKKRRCTNGIYTSQYGLDKSITMGKVEASVKVAVKEALKKLEDGGSVEDAKAVCEPNVLNQLFRWKKKLSVFLAPFLHGARYTSFGRHFTDVGKLKEIVDRLHWYVEDGDTIVDFCCGSNDFSCLMKEKLDTMGKRCKFKNYDIITPKVIGLNPPFGVQASLANKFINHALKFKPKLIILIVPQETRRLDRKSPLYDLIWEDRGMLSGKSFYLPGIVGISGQPLEDWNVKPPPLSLWSRPDWTARHIQEAKKRRHIDKKQNKPHQLACFGDFSNIMTNHPDISNLGATLPECGNIYRSSHTLDDVVDMELSRPVIHSTNLLCTQPNYLGQHPTNPLCTQLDYLGRLTNPLCTQPNYLGHLPGIAQQHDAYTSVSHVDYGPGVGYTQSGQYANHGYLGSRFNYDQPNYGYTTYPPNSSFKSQGSACTTYGQPDLTDDGTKWFN
ncbi:hypothetical protein QVD17_27302 [Tagetes erecta]|uniref:Zinc finger PHD-type domain-containing protein n=1 Tax=Tagetes erecta TaxID=13708 RepID=A0AAD8KAP9_TARER|nr:hypothetical protein QVD17_27302 [Tagetes erecta]